MAQNKISNSEGDMRSRMRKYDTYTPRPGMARRHQARSTNPNTNFVVPVPAHTDKSPVLRVVKNPPLVNEKQKRIISGAFSPVSQVKYSGRALTSSGNLTPSKSLALKAVGNAKLAENEVFPDQINTLFVSGKRKLSKFQKSIYAFGVMVLVFSSFVSIQSFINNKNAKDQIATLGASSSKDEQGVSEGNGDEPSEEAISNESILAYQVSNPEDPRYLRIPELKIFARIKNLGVDNKGAVDAPHNIYDAGWYNGSVRPGSKLGSSLILGHVSGWTAPGVFKNLKKLDAGVQFEIEKGSGQKIKYEVTRLENIPVDQVNMGKVLSAEVSGEHDLKLMTCGGKYDHNSKTYTERTIIYAKEIK